MSRSFDSRSDSSSVPLRHHDVDVAGQAEHRSDALGEARRRRHRPQLSSVGSTRSRVAATPSSTVRTRSRARIATSAGATHAASRGIESDRTAAADADAATAPAPAPASAFRRAPCCAQSAAELLQARKVDERQAVERGRRGPHPEQHARRRPARGRSIAAAGSRRDGTRACSRHTGARRRPCPRPKSMAADAGRRRRQRRAGEPEHAEHEDQREMPKGVEPTSDQPGQRKTTKSSGRMSASDPTVLRMLSRRITASVSTAIRCPPANSNHERRPSLLETHRLDGRRAACLRSRRQSHRAGSSARGRNRRRTAAAPAWRSAGGCEGRPTRIRPRSRRG